MEAIPFWKSSERCHKDFDALMIWFFRRINIEVYRNSGNPFFVSTPRRSWPHNHFTSSENGELCLVGLVDGISGFMDQTLDIHTYNFVFVAYFRNISFMLSLGSAPSEVQLVGQSKREVTIAETLLRPRWATFYSVCTLGRVFAQVKPCSCVVQTSHVGGSR